MSIIKKRREILKREEKSPSFPFEGNEGLPSLHGEMCATARTHLLGEKRATARPLLLGEKRATARPLLLQWSGMCEGATAGTVAPSHLLLKFGKLTIEFELLSQFRKVKPHRCGTVAPSHLLLKFGKLTTKFELLLQFREAEIRRPSAAAYGKAVPSHLSYLRSAS